MLTQCLLLEPDDKRKHRRAHIQRVSVRYELAPDQFIVGDVVEMSVEGMFIQASRPLPVGRLFTLEIRVLGEPLPLDAVGRVIWRRETSDASEAGETEPRAKRPSGFGVKLVDLDEAGQELLGRLVVVRQQTMDGIGPASPKRLPTRAPEPSSPFALARPHRATEPSIPFPLVTPLRVPEASVPFLLLAAREPGPSRPAVRAARTARAESRGGARRVIAGVVFFGLVTLLPQDGAGGAAGVAGWGRGRETFAALARLGLVGRAAATWVTTVARKSPWHEPPGSAITAGSSRSQER
jgi:hypothetical protein